MLFQGEEHGEPAPFQFFSDHIDEEIATATRDGRLREFAQFEAFAGQVPDPQDPATFEASKLTRERDTGLRDLYQQLIAVRRDLGPAEATAEHVDEIGRTLTVRRGDATLAMNFAREQRAVPVPGDQVVVATTDVRLEDGHAILPPLAGALVR